MGYNAKYGTFRPTEKDDQERLRGYRLKNLDMAYRSKSENWMQGILGKLYRETGIKFTRQKLHGVRIYDFWCNQLGVVVEVDGGYHNEQRKKQKDEKYDKYNYEVSGIKVYRIKPYDDCGALEMLKEIKKDIDRNQRRLLLGLKMTTAAKQKAQEKNKKKFFDHISDIEKGDTIYGSMKNKLQKKEKWIKRKSIKKLNKNDIQKKKSFDLLSNRIQ